MKNRSRVIFLVCILSCQVSFVYAFDIKSMFTSMGTQFGAPPVGYTYSFEVWSDASVPIYVEQQGIASFMGAYFPSAKGYYGKRTLPSIFDAAGAVSQGVYHNENYYFNMFIGKNSNPHSSSIYSQSLTQLPLVQHDPNVYYYHVYTGRGFSQGSSTHAPEVEMMGYQNPTQLSDPNSKTKGSVVLSSQLSALAFCNSSGTDVQVSLTYGTDPYTFTLEKYSFNTLNLPTPLAAASTTTEVSVAPVAGPAIMASATSATATSASTSVSAAIPAGQNVTIQAATAAESIASSVPPAFSLRPNTLSFHEVTQPSTPFKSFQLPAQGFDGFTYTIEVFQDPGQPLNVGIQGLTPGNYDIAVTPRVRDLTPCPCTFWYQSFSQGGSVQGYSDLPGQIWVAYAGVDGPIQSKVTPGEVVSWNLVRPLLSQGDQFVYFIYVATTNDAIAQKFVAKVMAQTLGKNIIQQYEQAVQTPITFAPVNQGLDVTGGAGAAVAPSITPDQEVATLMGSLNIANGVIEDTDQGIVGYIVGADVFTACGFGFGRFYYVLSPSVMSVSNIVSMVSGLLDSSKTSALGSSSTDIQTSITTTVTGWLTAYLNKPADVQKQVQQYLLQYGNSTIVTTDGSALTKFGQTCLQLIMTGSVSLKYPSMKLSTVTNQYVYDFGAAAPDKMPTAVTALKPLAPLKKSTSSTQASSKPVAG